MIWWYMYIYIYTYIYESEKWKWSRFSRVWLLATPWTAAYQVPPSMGFSRQEYWSGVPLPSPELRLRKTRFKASLDWLTTTANLQMFSHLRKPGETVTDTLSSFDAIFVSFAKIWIHYAHQRKIIWLRSMCP